MALPPQSCAKDDPKDDPKDESKCSLDLSFVRCHLGCFSTAELYLMTFILRPPPFALPAPIPQPSFCRLYLATFGYAFALPTSTDSHLSTITICAHYRRNPLRIQPCQTQLIRFKNVPIICSSEHSLLQASVALLPSHIFRYLQ